MSEHYSVTVLTWSPFAFRRERTPGLDVVVAPSLLRWDRDRSPFPAGLNSVFSICTGVLTALVLRRRWSVALAAGLHPEGTVAVLASGRHKRVIITTWLVGHLGTVERLSRSPLRRAVRPLIQRVSSFVAETPQAREELISLGLAPERIETITAGVDLGQI